MSPRFEIYQKKKKKRISKIAIWGPQNNYYFSLRVLHLFHDKTCIAKTKTQTKQKVGVGGRGSVKSGFYQAALRAPIKRCREFVWMSNCNCQYLFQIIIFRFKWFCICLSICQNTCKLGTNFS